MSVKPSYKWDPTAYNMSFSSALNAPMNADDKKLQMKKSGTIRHEIEFPIVLSHKNAIKADPRHHEMYQDWIRSFGYDIVTRTIRSGPIH